MGPHAPSFIPLQGDESWAPWIGSLPGMARPTVTTQGDRDSEVLASFEHTSFNLYVMLLIRDHRGSTCRVMPTLLQP